MGILSVADIAVRVRRQFGDEDAAQVIDTDIINWINDCLREIVQQNDLLQKVGNADAVAQQIQYSLPTDILRMQRVAYNGVALQPTTLEQVNESLPGTSETVAQGYPVGTPLSYWIFAGKINLYPAPDTSLTNGLTLYYTRQPVPVDSGDTPELPPEYDNRIVEYCLQQAFELDMNTTMMEVKSGQFQQGIDRLKGNPDWESQDSYPSITSTLEYPIDAIGGWY